MVHHGDYIVQNISGIRELVGSDVNLIHRLSKNHVSENTGWQAYALFSKKAMDSIDLTLEGLHEQDETYEHLGTVSTRTLDLLPRYEAIISARRVVVTAEEADIITVHEFNAPLAVTWDWIMDIKKRTEAMGDMGSWKVISRNKGRTGAGASNHCAHGRGGESTETIMDWRPFEYATVDNIDGRVQWREMTILTPQENDSCTRVESRIKLLKPFPLFLVRFMMKRQFGRENPYEKWYSRIDDRLTRQPAA